MIMARVFPGKCIETMQALGQNISQDRRKLINGFDSYNGNKDQPEKDQVVSIYENSRHYCQWLVTYKFPKPNENVDMAALIRMQEEEDRIARGLARRR